MTRRLLLLAAAAGLALLWWRGAGAGGAAALAWARGRQADLADFAAAHYLPAAAAYVLALAAITSLAVPIRYAAALLGGALFGAAGGSALTTLGNTAGASALFAAARYLLRDRLRARYAERLPTLQRELDEGGVAYLLALRLNPFVPSGPVNLLFGLTRLPFWGFIAVTVFGALPATVLFSVAGARLSDLASPEDVLWGPLPAALVGLSLLPPLARLLRTTRAL